MRVSRGRRLIIGKVKSNHMTHEANLTCKWPLMTSKWFCIWLMQQFILLYYLDGVLSQRFWKKMAFFRQKDKDQSDSRILQSILRLENETCFADNEEQGTQRIFDLENFMVCQCWLPMPFWQGKILENSQEIALIFTLSTSLLGIFILIHGFIRDYFGYGFARLEIYVLLTLSYALLGISTPGSSDALQYFWIIQFGCIIAGSLNGKQFFTLFPNQFGFLIGNDFK